jgi:hypothetical protein
MTYVDKSDEDRPDHKDRSPGQTVTFENLFPFEGPANKWEYADDDGNRFTIHVMDTISDEEELYYKVAFTEEKLDFVQDDWFLRKGGRIKFNTHLRGEFQTFLPSSFKKNGGWFYCHGSSIRYKVMDSMTIGEKTFENVLELEYNRSILHGFDRIVFADNIGIIRMVDEDGRWEIDYVLKESHIDGEKTEY